MRDFDPLDAGSWMLLPPRIGLWLLAVLALMTTVLLLFALLRYRHRRGGWLILAGALPLMVAGATQFYNTELYGRMLVMLPYPLEGTSEWSVAFREYLMTARLGLLLAFGPGLIGLFIGIWLVRFGTIAKG